MWQRSPHQDMTALMNRPYSDPTLRPDRDLRFTGATAMPTMLVDYGRTG